MVKNIVDERVESVLVELEKRQKRLDTIKSKNAGNKKEAFLTGARLVQDMISGQKDLIEQMVYDAPQSALEQQRNMMLLTGNMGQSPQAGFKATTDAIDAMLITLEAMGHQK